MENAFGIGRKWNERTQQMHYASLQHRHTTVAEFRILSPSSCYRALMTQLCFCPRVQKSGLSHSLPHSSPVSPRSFSALAVADFFFLFFFFFRAVGNPRSTLPKNVYPAAGFLFSGKRLAINVADGRRSLLSYRSRFSGIKRSISLVFFPADECFTRCIFLRVSRKP